MGRINVGGGGYLPGQVVDVKELTGQDFLMDEKPYLFTYEFKNWVFCFGGTYRDSYKMSFNGNNSNNDEGNGLHIFDKETGKLIQTMDYLNKDTNNVKKLSINVFQNIHQFSDENAIVTSYSNEATDMLAFTFVSEKSYSAYNYNENKNNKSFILLRYGNEWSIFDHLYDMSLNSCFFFKNHLFRLTNNMILVSAIDGYTFKNIQSIKYDNTIFGTGNNETQRTIIHNLFDIPKITKNHVTGEEMLWTHCEYITKSGYTTYKIYGCTYNANTGITLFDHNFQNILSLYNTYSCVIYRDKIIYVTQLDNVFKLYVTQVNSIGTDVIYIGNYTLVSPSYTRIFSSDDLNKMYMISCELDGHSGNMIEFNKYKLYIINPYDGTYTILEMPRKWVEMNVEIYNSIHTGNSIKYNLNNKPYSLYHYQFLPINISHFIDDKNIHNFYVLKADKIILHYKSEKEDNWWNDDNLYREYISLREIDIKNPKFQRVFTNKNGDLIISENMYDNSNQRIGCTKTLKFQTMVSPSIYKKKYKTMTVKIDRNNPTGNLEYLDDAISMKAGYTDWDSFFGINYATLNAQGDVIYYLEPQSRYYIKNTFEGRNLGNNQLTYVVELPLRGLKIESTDDYIVLSMTDEPNKDGFQYLAHTDKYGTIKDKLYISQYYFNDVYGNNGLVRSKPDYVGVYGKTLSEFQTLLTNPLFEIMGYHQLMYLQAMFLLKHKTLQSKTIGYGVGNKTSFHNNSTNNQPATWGYGLNEENKGQNHLNLFGIKDMWGNAKIIIGDIKLKKISDTKCQIVKFRNNKETILGETNIIGGFNTIKDIVGTNNLGFFPLSTQPIDNQYYCSGATIMDGANIGDEHLLILGHAYNTSLSDLEKAGIFNLTTVPIGSEKDNYTCVRYMKI